MPPAVPQGTVRPRQAAPDSPDFDAAVGPPPAIPRVRFPLFNHAGKSMPPGMPRTMACSIEEETGEAIDIEKAVFQAFERRSAYQARLVNAIANIEREMEEVRSRKEAVMRLACRDVVLSELERILPPETVEDREDMRDLANRWAFGDTRNRILAVKKAESLGIWTEEIKAAAYMRTEFQMAEISRQLMRLEARRRQSWHDLDEIERRIGKRTTGPLDED